MIEGETLKWDPLERAGGVSRPPNIGQLLKLTMKNMSDFSDWRIDCSRLTLAQRQAGPGIPLIGDGEIKMAVHSSRHWYESAAYPPSEHHFFLIGYTEKLRFLLVALSYSGDETLTVHDIAIPDEDQIQDLFCGGPAS